MGIYEKLEKGLCPNGCGKIQKLEKPIAILYVVPPDLLELLYEGHDTPENIFGHILAHCDECGFNLTTAPKEDAFDHLDNITVLGIETPPLFSAKSSEKKTEEI